MQTVIKDLKIRSSSGSSDLKSASQIVFPLPGERTLQGRTRHIEFQPGVQRQVLDAFDREFESFEEDGPDYLIYFDDMAIKSRRDWDNGTRSFLGHVTLPGVEGLARKATVFIFEGVRRRWKVTAAYHFVPNEGSSEQIKTVLLELLQKALDMKLNALGFVCDTGNRSVLKRLGLSFHRTNIVLCVPHPLDPDRKLYCFPDMVQLYKSFKEVFCSNGEITLSQDIVDRKKNFLQMRSDMITSNSSMSIEMVRT